MVPRKLIDDLMVPRVLVIKSAKGDTPTQDNFYQGASGNKMPDTYNTERFTVMVSKSMKLKAGNIPTGVQTVGSGFQIGTPTVSRATRIFNISIPGRRFSRSGVIQYEKNDMQPKFFDYHLAFFAYSNCSTTDSAAAFNVARVNDAFTKLHYKHA